MLPGVVSKPALGDIECLRYIVEACYMAFDCMQSHDSVIHLNVTMVSVHRCTYHCAYSCMSLFILWFDSSSTHCVYSTL